VRRGVLLDVGVIGEMTRQLRVTGRHGGTGEGVVEDDRTEVMLAGGVGVAPQAPPSSS
jgi:hypothetical protein